MQLRKTLKWWQGSEQKTRSDLPLGGKRAPFILSYFSFVEKIQFVWFLLCVMVCRSRATVLKRGGKLRRSRRGGGEAAASLWTALGCKNKLSFLDGRCIAPILGEPC